ncbi:hypothetical protein B0H10DRAFT_2226895 [Mycena sp. CBHHK59/15]|nr:hypothetical protein B0H10DRAFT_2226895 [Mycena sp. CBHHK59/15]
MPSDFAMKITGQVAVLTVFPEDDENEDHRQYANHPFTKKCLTTALGIRNSTVTSDRKLFASGDIPYNPLAKKWVNGNIDLDSKVRAKFKKMKRAEWLAYLAEAKAAKVAADEAEEKEATKEVRRKKKSIRQRNVATNPTAALTLPAIRKKKDLKRKLKKIHTKKGIYVSEVVLRPNATDDFDTIATLAKFGVTTKALGPPQTFFNVPQTLATPERVAVTPADLDTILLSPLL